MQIRKAQTFLLAFTLAASTALVAGPVQDIQEAPSSAQSSTIMEELIVTGARSPARDVKLDAAEAARPAAAHIPQIDEQTWMPQSTRDAGN